MDPDTVTILLDIVRRVNDTLADMHACNTGSANGGPNNDGYYPIRDLSGVPKLQISPAKLATLVPTGQPIDFTLDCFADRVMVSAGTRIRPIRASRPMTVGSVRASLYTPDTSPAEAGGLRIDVLVNGASILSSPLRILPGQLSSRAPGTPAAVVAVPAIPDDAEISITVLSAGMNARGLRVTLIGNYA